MYVLTCLFLIFIIIIYYTWCAGELRQSSLGWPIARGASLGSADPPPEEMGSFGFWGGVAYARVCFLLW